MNISDGKGHSLGIIEDFVIKEFNETFMQSTMPFLAEKHMQDLATKRAVRKDEDEATSLLAVEKEYKTAGEYASSFDSGTPAAIKQMRHKLLMANCGSLNFEMDECYTGDIEVLTSKGYVRFDKLTGSEIVAQFDTTNDLVTFVKPSRFIDKPYKGDIYNLVTPTGFDMSVTPNHEVLVCDGRDTYKKVKACDLNTGHRIPLVGKSGYVGNDVLTDCVKLAIAIQADGTLRNSGCVEISFKKERKIVKFKQLLSDLDIAHTCREQDTGYTYFYLPKAAIESIKLSKNLWEILPSVDAVSFELAKEILAEVVKWDGHIDTNLPNVKRYTAKDKHNVDYINIIAALAGYKTKVNSNNKEGYVGGYYVTWNENSTTKAGLSYLHKKSGNQEPIQSITEMDGRVYCVTVHSGSIVLRRNGKTFIGGNCGSNLLTNQEALTTFLELYDKGKIKQKLTKNTNESVRSEEILGATPTNMLLFGTPSKLFNGGKTEDEYFAMLETGYARRCIFGFGSANDKIHNLSPSQLYDKLVTNSTDAYLDELAVKLEALADVSNFERVLTMSRAVSELILEYQMSCEAIAHKLPEHEEIRKAEISHRYFKALKLAGAYAFIDSSYEITMDHFYSAMKLVEESGEAFCATFTRERPYEKLAKYLGNINRRVTHTELMEDLPFYKGSESVRREQMTLAISWGYRNNTVIKKVYEEGIEFLQGETLKETSLDKILVSQSRQLGENYIPALVPFSDMHTISQDNGNNWVNHQLQDGIRRAENAIPGFNCIVVDVDEGVTIDLVKLLLKNYTYHLYTTKRHQQLIDDKQHGDRFRIVIPISHVLKMGAGEYKEFIENVYEWLPFTMDEGVNQRERKWASHKGTYFNNDGEVLDALQFIPKTSKNEARKQFITDNVSLTNVERWFVGRTGEGNRNKNILSYALMLVDSGKSFDEVRTHVMAFNNKIQGKLEEMEIDQTIMVTAMSRIAKRGN